MVAWKRAATPFEKSDMTEALCPLWIRTGDMRLGQLIYNAVSEWLLENNKAMAARDISRLIFYVEDADLLEMLTSYVKAHYPEEDTASTSS